MLNNGGGLTQSATKQLKGLSNKISTRRWGNTKDLGNQLQ